MASGLRAKLQAMAPGPAAPAASAAPMASAAPASGLVLRVDRRPAPEGLLNLPARGLSRLGAPDGFSVERCLFLDTETTGLSGGAGTVAFLVGAGYLDGAEFVTEQFMLGDYSDEPEMLLRLSELFGRFDAAVTFNGKAFDMPLLEARYTLSRLGARWRPLSHLDLLHPARRVWKLRLKSCRLAQLEERVLGVRRVGDIPGSEVPERFFRYLSTGDRSVLDDVLRHNLQDIVTLGVLLARLAELFDRPHTAGEGLDLFSLGRALERQGDGDAGSLYELSRDVPEGSFRLYNLYRRAGDWQSARTVLEDMVRRNQLGWVPHIELSKILEHREHNYRRAAFFAKIALAMCGADERPEIERRIRRLERKQLGGGLGD